MTSVRKEAIKILSQSPIFCQINNVYKEEAVVHFIVNTMGTPEQREKLWDQEKKDAAELTALYWE